MRRSGNWREAGVGALKRSIGGENAIPLFTDGQCAFLVSGPWAINDIKTAGIAYDITPVPPFADGQTAQPFVGAQVFFVASKGKNKAVAQEFVANYLTSVELAVALYEAEPRAPALTAALEQVQANDPDLPKFLKAAENGVPMPSIPEMAAIWEPFGTAEAAIVGGADVDEAVDAAADAIADTDRMTKSQRSVPGSTVTREPTRTPSPARVPLRPLGGRLIVTGLVVKAVLLGLVAAIALWAAFPLWEARAWVGLAILVATTVAIFYLYLSRRHIPAKYLLPGTLFLIAFQLFPVLYTVSTAFTNFGDGHRGDKPDAIVAIQTASVRQVPDSAEYTLSVATTGDPATGDLVFLVRDSDTGQAYVGDQEGLRPLPADQVQVGLDGRINHAEGYTILTVGQASARSPEITEFAVPTERGAILAAGLSRAYEGRAQRTYDSACDCVTDHDTGERYYADETVGAFVSDSGQQLVPGWRVNVGFANFTRVLTDPRVSGPFLSTLVWNFAFAFGSVALTFGLGAAIALALHSDRLRGRTLYRVLLVLPYAMPAFAMLLVWRDMFNADFGLINQLFGLSVEWLNDPWGARAAVLLVTPGWATRTCSWSPPGRYRRSRRS